MGIVIQNYTFHNLSCLIYVCIKTYLNVKSFFGKFLNLSFESTSPFIVRGKTESLEKNYPSIY